MGFEGKHNLSFYNYGKFTHSQHTHTHTTKKNHRIVAQKAYDTYSYLYKICVRQARQISVIDGRSLTQAQSLTKKIL